MRTTLNIDDDILQVARSLAEARKISVGQALSDLARKGLRSSRPSVSEEGIPVFSVQPNDPPVTPEMIRKAMEEW